MTLTISDSTFVNNSSLSGGTGAIFNASGATLNIHDSTFWNNIAGIGEGGAFYNAGAMTVTGQRGRRSWHSDGVANVCYSSGSCPATGDGNGNVGWRRHSGPFALGQLRWPDRDDAAGDWQGPGDLRGRGSGTPYAETVSGTALTTDERGMPLDSSCSAGETDAGAVQGSNLCKTGNTNPNPNPAMFAATQDFNGDCKSDVLWRNSSTQQVYEWLMNGTTFTSGSTGSPTSDWVIQGSGGFERRRQERHFVAQLDHRTGLHLADEREHADEQRQSGLCLAGLDHRRHRGFYREW